MLVASPSRNKITMKKSLLLYISILLAVAVIVIIALVPDRTHRMSAVATLSSSAGELDLPEFDAIVDPDEEFSGGATTVRDTGPHSFGRVPMNLTSFDTNWIYFREGRKVFDRSWYATRGGHLLLGPQFNGESCASCHKFDGRGQPPMSPEDNTQSLVVRLSVPHGDTAIPEPTYGGQLNFYAVEGTVPEGRVAISYEEIEGLYADGTSYTLHVPSYEFRYLGYGPLARDVQFSPRVAPAIFGLGLLEAIPAESVLALADPDDRDGDGISGRPNYVRDIRTGKSELGRFGWKATQPTVAHQILRAFIDDIGITSPAYPDDGTVLRSVANATKHHPELKDEQFDPLLYYTKLLAVPARRNWRDPIVRRGRAIFRHIGCEGCHTSRFVTGEAEGYPELSNQTIRPYTDLLLHDMGEGLADNRPDGLANSREWRTPPLWGIGLVQAVNGHTFFLHDGRARDLEEAVLWHGGEAATAQNLYRRLRREDRRALIRFLESL